MSLKYLLHHSAAPEGYQQMSTVQNCNLVQHMADNYVIIYIHMVGELLIVGISLYTISLP